MGRQNNTSTEEIRRIKVLDRSRPLTKNHSIPIIELAIKSLQSVEGWKILELEYRMSLRKLVLGAKTSPEGARVEQKMGENRCTLYSSARFTANFD